MPPGRHALFDVNNCPIGKNGGRRPTLARCELSCRHGRPNCDMKPDLVDDAEWRSLRRPMWPIRRARILFGQFSFFVNWWLIKSLSLSLPLSVPVSSCAHLHPFHCVDCHRLGLLYKNYINGNGPLCCVQDRKICSLCIHVQLYNKRMEIINNIYRMSTLR